MPNGEDHDAIIKFGERLKHHTDQVEKDIARLDNSLNTLVDSVNNVDRRLLTNDMDTERALRIAEKAQCSVNLLETSLLKSLNDGLDKVKLMRNQIIRWLIVSLLAGTLLTVLNIAIRGCAS